MGCLVELLRRVFLHRGSVPGVFLLPVSRFGEAAQGLGFRRIESLGWTSQRLIERRSDASGLLTGVMPRVFPTSFQGRALVAWSRAC